MSETLTQSISEATLDVEGMDCASCVSHVEKAAGKVAGVEACSVSLALGKAVVRFNADATSPQAIAAAITTAGYPSQPKDIAIDPARAEQHRVDRQRDEARSWFQRAMLGIALWLPVELSHWISYLVQRGGHAAHDSVSWMTWISLAAGTIAMVLIGGAFFRSALRSLRAGTTNMDVLISMGAGTAYFYSLAALLGHLVRGWPLAHLYFMESAGLLALISLGHWLESRARETAGSAIRKLMSLSPTTAHKLIGLDSEVETPVSGLNRGDKIIIKPGDRVPIDGVVYAGRSTLDESMISGEAVPVSRQTGDAVIGGTVNIDGVLRIRVSKVGSETALAQIIKLVEDAQTSKPAVQRLADRISAVFVPAVVGIALLTGIGWFAHGTITHLEKPQIWANIANAVCSVLIIACPCALGLAVPAALMVGTGRGAARGILIRDIDALQQAEQIQTVVLDKTGTLTAGKPVVRGVYVEYARENSLDENALLRLAAAAERGSTHPLAQSIVAAALEMKLSIPEAGDFVSEPGRGVRATVEGKAVLAGNAELLSEHGAIDANVARSIVETSEGHSVVMIAIDGAFAGHIELGDTLKHDSAAAIERIHAMGLKTIVLSGDNETTARQIAAAAGIADVRANVKPDGKVRAIQALQSGGASGGSKTSRVAMVGDGINDAPALAAADLGIAIGSGSDVAKEAGGIVLVSGSLSGVPAAIRLSQATMRKIRQNLVFAFMYNVLAIPLAAAGLLNPMIAAAAMALSDVTVIGNALLLRKSKID
ncbi:MAG TPA: heavy metal translocating P-type ATPase [Tepidisphaeraceae bacterium]|nr:heavy metal translocating P-type ATPase [Tepidisphaeraceae bacterium]